MKSGNSGWNPPASWGRAGIPSIEKARIDADMALSAGKSLNSLPLNDVPNAIGTAYDP